MAGIARAPWAAAKELKHELLGDGFAIIAALETHGSEHCAEVD